ncbi:GAF and ANTAR domain-containing protein [Amycolatopsis acidicola]|uniref:GAF and ANTAR domain-containing protein n=1 Tax=Amycolatopsis acidicola TaxID=2596893 RepID=A0A5N0UVU3_9PSEU|nr:GAF and ANTAR domain-containing protein [Amycolatopsis acidicola]KAA9153004.1 GAF and ANTAR domain-containing protein [Amycolatopsis acidicola]
MNQNKAAGVWSAIVARARDEAAPVALRHVCLACAEAVSADDAALLLASTLQSWELACATNPLGEELVELQTTYGEGPAIDAAAGFGPVLVEELDSPMSHARWPAYAPEARRAGACAQFSIPLRVGAVRLGALDLFRRTPGPLSAAELAEAVVYADAALAIVLNTRAGSGRNATEEDFLARGAELHQAAGMVSVQLGVPVAEAMVRLRAYAYRHGERLRDVAHAVVSRQLRFGRSEVGGDGLSEGDRS